MVMDKMYVVFIVFSFYIVLIGQSFGEEISNKENLSIEQVNIIKAYKTVVRLDLINDDLARVNAYDVLYKKADPEYKNTKESILYKEFLFDYTGIPLIIAQIIRDSNTMSAQQKMKLLFIQKKRSSDERIDAIIIKEMCDKKEFDKAICYCCVEIQKGRENIRPLLIKSRLLFQLYLIKKALRKKGVETWNPSVISPYQLRHAIIDAEEGIEKNPDLLPLYESILCEQFNNLNAYNEALLFYNKMVKNKKVSSKNRGELRRKINLFIEKKSKDTLGLNRDY